VKNSFVLACGQGIENCNEAPVDQSLITQCQTSGPEGGPDPRTNWRGLAIAIDQQGDIEWYRMDNWGQKGEEPTSSSAFEWVSYDPSDETSLGMVTN